MDTIRDKVVELVLNVCRPFRPDLSDQSRALLTAGLDSLDFATLLMAVEDSFDVTVSDADLTKLVSIDEIVKFVEERKSA